MKSTALILAGVLLLVATACAAPMAPEGQVRVKRHHKGHGMMGGFGFGHHEEPPPPPIQPGITTIFYSPFFPVLPPQPYSNGNGYGSGNHGGGGYGGH